METLALQGDVMLGRLVNDALGRAPPEYPWGDMLGVLGGADWRCCNLECSSQTWSWRGCRAGLSTSGRNAGNVAALQAPGIDMVSNANNHSLDFGHEAMLDMLTQLDGPGIAHAGAGADRATARRPALVNDELARLHRGMVSWKGRTFEGFS